MKYTNHIQITGLAVGDDGMVTEDPATLIASVCECGLLVGSWTAHDDWHAKLAARLDPSPGQVEQNRATKVAAKVAGRRRA